VISCGVCGGGGGVDGEVCVGGKRGGKAIALVLAEQEVVTYHIHNYVNRTKYSQVVNILCMKENLQVTKINGYQGGVATILSFEPP